MLAIMLRLRHLNASVQDQVCLAAGGEVISLITFSPLSCHTITRLPGHVDGRIALLSLYGMVVYADWYKGIKALSVEGRVLWTLKVTKVTKLRVSQDGKAVIVCRNDPPEVVVVDPVGGKILESIKGVTDGFFESANGDRALLNLSNNLVIRSSGKSSEMMWGEFALFSGFFRCGLFYVSGTSQSLAIYDIETMSLVSFAHSRAFVRCDPLAWNETRQELIGVVFEFEGQPVTSLVSFNECLEVKAVITTTALLWGAAIFEGGERMLTSNGKLIDTSTGDIIDEFESLS